MEREVSSAVHICVMLVAVSALIGIVMFTVYLGNSIKMDAANDVANLNTSVSSSQLSSLKSRNNIVIPMAAAYSLLAKESDFITSAEFFDADGNVTYAVPNDSGWMEVTNPTDTINEALNTSSTLQGLLDGRVSGKVEIEVEYNRNDTYTVRLYQAEA